MQENFYYQYYYWKKQDDFKKSNIAGIKKWGLLTGMCVLAYFVLQNIISTLIRITPFYDLYSQSDIVQHATGMIIAVSTIFLPFFVLSLVYKNGRVFKSLMFSKPASKGSFLVFIIGGFALCMLANFAASWLMGIFSMVGLEPDSGAADVSPETGVLGFIMSAIKIAVVPALVEEFAVRGVMMQPLRKYGDGFAIMASSLIFALMHASVVQGAFAFVVGLVLGYVVVATGSIWTGVLLHFINNMFSVIISGISTLSITAGNIVYWVVAIPVIVLGVLLIIKYLRSGNAYRLRKPQTYLSGNEKIRAFISAPTIIISIIFLGITAIIGLV